MKLFHSAAFVVSMALMLPFGSSVVATTLVAPPPPPNLANPHPPLSIAEGRTLNLRESGSRIVVETIEDALRSGGLALLGEGFQLDSSLSWVFGETIQGEVDAVVPLWSRGRHVVFAQPGAVFWTGIEEEERIDGNLGVVYRTMSDNGVVSGISLFYDHDFQIGHSRLGIGVDAQSGSFYGAFNYYHPLSDTQDGREGYVEDALQGMDINLAIESNVTRFGSNVGYWKFQGDEDVKDDWKFSYGVDAGFRIIPGIFLEGSLQSHDKDVSLGQRAKVGLAFKFSLPDFKGKSYGDGSGPSDLYKIVERESRILYEEREAVAKANLVVSGTGNTRNVAVQLEETFAEEVVLNLIGTGTATYNDDWTISVGGDNCPVVDGTDCSVTVMAGDTSPSDEVVITFQDPARGEPAEDIILSVEIASTGVELAPGNPVVVQIPEGEPLPTVSLSVDKASIAEGETATITVTLSETLGRQSEFILTGSTDGAIYGILHDYTFNHSGGDCGRGCSVTIPANQASSEVTVNVNTDSMNETTAETFTASLTVHQSSQDIVALGSPSILNFTIPEEDPLPTVSWMADATSITEGNTATITFTLSEALTGNVTFNLSSFSFGRAATYGTSADWNLSVGGTDCNMATFGSPCQVTIDEGDTTAEVIVKANTDMDVEMTENITITVEIDSMSRSIVALGNSGTLQFTIEDPPPTISVSGGHGSDPTKITDEIDEGRSGSAELTITISPAPTSQISIPLTVTGSHAAYGDSFAVTGGTLTGTPSAGNLMLLVAANTSTVTLTITAAQDGADGANDITVSLGTPLPGDYIAGTASTWEIRIHDDD